MSIRLEARPFEYNGKKYLLRCNMAVLDALQEQHNGDFGELMNLQTFKAIPEILAAMMNDYADEKGWPERVTAKELSRNLTYADLVPLDITGIFTRAIVPAATEKEGKN